MTDDHIYKPKITVTMLTIAEDAVAIAAMAAVMPSMELGHGEQIVEDTQPEVCIGMLEKAMGCPYTPSLCR